MRWAGPVANMRAMIRAYKIVVRKPKGKQHLGNLGINGK
jgi:hypothetical protein